VASVVNRFMDFCRSLDRQEVVCELTACYVLSTYFLDAFNVAGYLWPNGEPGSGKTNYLHTVCELAYLGQVILAGGSYASLRDLADYGATLAFDDAEGIMDLKRADPDKRALLLAGNRRGATVTVKEQVGDRWVTRHIHAFCARLFSAVRLPDGTLGSRTIIVPLIRSDDGDRANADPLDPAAWPCDRRRLVDDLWALGLAHLAELRECDARVPGRARLMGRNLEPWRAVLAVALWLQEGHGQAGLFDRMEELSRKYQEERGSLEAGDPVRVLILALRRLLDSRDAAEPVPKDVAAHMNEVARGEDLADEGKDFTNPRRVGWLLKRLRFQRLPNDRTKRWQVTRAELDTIARAYGMGATPTEAGQQAKRPETAERETF
jgi:hypothetical protein